MSRLSPPRVDKRGRMCGAAGLVKPRHEAQSHLQQALDAAKSKLSAVPAKSDDPEAVHAKEPKKSDDDSDAPELLSAQDGAGDQRQKSKKTNKPRTRPCEAQIRQNATRLYLGQLGITYGEFMSTHNRCSTSKKAGVCGVGGFVKLQKLLCSGRMPVIPGKEEKLGEKHCYACCLLLKQGKFSQTSLIECCEAACAESMGRVSGDAVLPSGPGVVAMIGQQQDDGNAPEDLQVVHQKQNPDQGNTTVQEWIQAHPKVVAQLPPGTEKRVFPAQCLVCSRFYRRRVVFDLVKLKKMQYLNQHVDGPRHRKAELNLQGFNARSRDTPKSDILPVMNGSDDQFDSHPPPDPPGDDDGDGDFGDGPDKPNKNGKRMVDCQGFTFDDFPNCRLSQLRSEFAWYFDHAAFENASTLGKAARELSHRYVHQKGRADENSKLIIFHHSCKKTVQLEFFHASGEDGQDLTGWDQVIPKVCSSCTSIASDKTIIRNVCRFWAKYLAALLLKAKLFQKEAVKNIEDHLNDSTIVSLCSWMQHEAKVICDFSVPQLQKYVRAGFLSVPPSKMPPALKFLVGSLVMPSLHVSLHACADNATKHAKLVALHMTECEMDKVSDLDLKLGCLVASGGLRAHPMLHGILVMVAEKLRRAENGVYTMKGLNLTDEARAIVSESAMSLAVAAGNKQLLRAFGMLSQKPRVDLSQLIPNGLPDPFCALANLQVMRDSAMILDNMYPKRSECPVRRFICAFDKTYLLKCVSVLKHSFGRGLVGTAWRMRADLENPPTQSERNAALKGCLVTLTDEAGNPIDRREPVVAPTTDSSDRPDDALLCDNYSTIDHAREMLVCLLWDPASRAQGMPRFPLLELPTGTDACSVEMLQIIGEMMVNSGREKLMMLMMLMFKMFTMLLPSVFFFLWLLCVWRCFYYNCYKYDD